MRPLLREGRDAGPHGQDPAERDAHESYVDSEQDDTNYVINQMQKSRESLSVRHFHVSPGFGSKLTRFVKHVQITVPRLVRDLSYGRGYL